MRKITTSILTLLILFASSAYSQINKEELAKWEGRKYSMFIHWGIYSVPGGVWEGKQISKGLSEQIQAHAGIYSDTYAAIADTFNPEKWDAREIAKLAKNAGMKSIVFTSKHHDGFCMFDTQTTNFDIIDATPYKRDVLKELSDACKEEGLKFGLYYSNIDWNYPPAMPISSHNSDRVPDEHFQFSKAQLEELLTKYGEISELWFDMGSYTLEQSIELKALVRKYQPNCMVGSRLGNGQGDFMVMGDNQEPTYIIGVPWQSPASFFPETWSYRSWQKRVPEKDKYDEKLRSLINVCARGGNFLLNIGPRGDGSVVEYERNILLQIGKWLEKNGEAIYNTYADPFHKNFDWGTVTCKKNNIYLHVTNAPNDRKIEIPKFNGSISSVSILGENTKCKYSNTKDGVVIQLPNTVTSDDVSVVNIKLKNGFTTAPLNIISAEADTKLNQFNAFNYYSHSGVDYNTVYQSTIKQAWTLLPNKTEQTTPTLNYSAQEVGKTAILTLNGKTQNVVFDESNPTELDNDLSSIKWGDIYMQDPRQSGLEGYHGDITQIDVNKEWDGKPWKKTDYKNNQSYTLRSKLRTAYNAVQQIYSPKAQKVVVAITSGDGVNIVLNGKELVNHGNLEQTKSKRDIVLLDLKEGNNFLFIKLFSNGFHKEFDFSIDYNIPQRVYYKQLPKVQFTKGKYFMISMEVPNPISIHETMNTPNLNLQFVK